MITWSIGVAHCEVKVEARVATSEFGKERVDLSLRVRNVRSFCPQSPKFCRRCDREGMELTTVECLYEKTAQYDLTTVIELTALHTRFNLVRC